MSWIVAALGTAFFFAASNLIAYEAARELGGIVFSFLRTALASAGFLVIVLLTEWDGSLTRNEVLLLAASGLSGVFLADSLRYAALARLGPRMNTLVHTTSVPFSLLCGAVFLGQHVTGLSLLGTSVVFAGIVVAVAFGNRAAAGVWDGTPGQRAAGIGLALAAALSFAVSLLVAAPVMERGADPVTATAIRAMTGTLATLVPATFIRANRHQIARLNRRLALQVLMSGLAGTGIGLTLQLYALERGPVGIVSALSASTPIVLLPMVWMLTRRCPPVLAWVGAALAVAGIAVIYAGEF